MSASHLTTFDPEILAELWPGRGVLQVNHGSFGRVPDPTATELHALLDAEQDNPQGWFRAVPERVAQAREFLAGWIGADPARTGLVRNASAGMTIAIGSALQGAAPGARIVYTDHSYGAVEFAIQRVARLTGATPVRVQVPLDADDDGVVAALAPFLDGSTLLVVDQITSATAKLMPVAALTALAGAAGVRIAIDGAHVPGMLPAPLTGLDRADFWVGNFHKWPCTPRGTAALVVGERRLDTVPAVTNWAEHESLPRRFDRQGTDSYGAWLAAPHAVDLIEQRLGWDQVRDRGSRLAEEAQQLICDALGTALPEVGTPAPMMRLAPLPAGVVTDKSSGAAIRDKLARDHQIETAITSFAGQGYLRISAHAYNEPKDYLRLAAAVRDVLG